MAITRLLSALLAAYLVIIVIGVIGAAGFPTALSMAYADDDDEDDDKGAAGAGSAAQLSTQGASPEDEKKLKEARKLLEEGDKAIGKGDRRASKGRKERAKGYYEKALEKYQKAYEVARQPTIYFAIATAEVKLERYMQAIEHYRKVVSEVNNQQLKEQALERIGEIKQYVATVTFRVTPNGAEINVDAELRGVAPLLEPLFLTSGEHTVTVTAEGYTPFEETIKLEAGSEIDREIKLEKMPVIVKQPKSGPPRVSQGDRVDQEDDDVPLPRSQRGRKFVKKPGKGMLVLGTVLTMGLAGGATFTGLSTLSKEDTFNDETASRDDRNAAQDSGKTYALVTDVLIVGAVVAGVYTTYHYFAVYRPKAKAYKEQQERRKNPLLLSPYFHEQGGGLAVFGRF